MNFRKQMIAVAAVALIAAGCGEKEKVDGTGAGGTAGSGGSGGQGGSGGTAGMGGSGGSGGVGGSGGLGGSGGDAGFCGDGKLDDGEECDGAAVPQSCTDLGYDAGTAGCTPACELDVSDCVGFEDCSTPGDEDGDGFADCDDSDCATAWECPSCGNGVLQEGEACDGSVPPGQSCLDFGFSRGTLECDPVSCEIVTDDCRNITCGDGIREGTELCDDGNVVSGDGCSADCVLEGNSCAVPRTIDDRHRDSTTGIWTIESDSTAYRPKFPASCGDALAQKDVVFSFTAPENGFFAVDLQAAYAGLVTVWDDACATAAAELACGTAPTSVLVGLAANQTVHIVADGAAPGLQEGPFTLVVEQRSTCGDGVIQPDEACDFGDVIADDGCSPTCVIEPGWTCDATGCEPPSCGNGALDAGERCDDGNTTDGDGCDSTCQIEWTLETEPNNSFAATGVQHALAGTGANGSGDGDFWVLPVTDGTTYVIHTATAPDGSCGTADTDDTRLTLYHNRVEIQDQDGGGPGLCASITFTAGPGDYHLWVRDGSRPGGVPVYYFWVEAQ